MSSFTENKIVRRYVLDFGEDRIFDLSQEGLDLYQKLSGKHIKNGYDLYQDDPYVIKVLDMLGTEKASGEYSELKIVEVKEGTIGVVYNPMRGELHLAHDGQKLFKTLAGYDFCDTVPRHNKHLVEVYEKLGDRASCYPIDFIEIDYIPEDEIDSYEICREEDYEKVIYSKNRYKNIYGLYYCDGLFENSLHTISFRMDTLRKIMNNLLTEDNSDKYSIKSVSIYELKDIKSKEELKENKYAFLNKLEEDHCKDLLNTKYYGFNMNIEKDFPLEIEEKDGSRRNSSLQVYVTDTVLLYIEHDTDLESLRSIKNYEDDLSISNIQFDVYYENGLMTEL
jgi:hypothetical protein